MDQTQKTPTNRTVGHKFRWFVIPSLLGVLILALTPSSGQTGETGTGEAPPRPEFGVWYDDTGRGAVRISPCGNRVCGHIVWLENPLNKDGEPLHDVYNPDPKKRDRPICGLQIIGNLEQQNDGTFDDGWVYDPKVGRTFNVAINLVNDTKLHVRGYAKLKIFGKSMTWKRAPADLELCTQAAP